MARIALHPFSATVAEWREPYRWLEGHGTLPNRDMKEIQAARYCSFMNIVCCINVQAYRYRLRSIG